MSVDLPAPFSPTIAWTVARRTLSSIRLIVAIHLAAARAAASALTSQRQ